MRHTRNPAPQIFPPNWTLRDRVGVLIAALAAGAASHAAPPPSDALGTLFYSPAERLMISRAREGILPAGPQSNHMVISGVVRRESAKNTAWINGQAVTDGESIESINRVRITERGVILDGKSVRVGEKLELLTGTKTDLVEPGAVSVTGRK